MEYWRKIERMPPKIIKRSWQTYWSIFGHRDYQRFVVVGHARTGSNYLFNGLSTSRAINMHHEIFAEHNREKGKDFDKIISLLYRKQAKGVKQVGFKLFYYHLTEDEWAKFASRDEFKMIHIIRRNRLRILVSLEIAFKTHQWAIENNNGQPKNKQIVLDPSTLIERIEKIGEYENAFRKNHKNREVIEIFYEDLASNPDREFGRIGEFLSITDINQGAITHKRQNPEPLSNLIVNFDEISRVLNSACSSEYLNG